MGTIRDMAERHWEGGGDLVFDEHPVRPIADRRAEEIADGVLCLKSIASVTALDTGDGLIMLDTGGFFDRDVVYDSVRAWRPDARLADAVSGIAVTADHAWGGLELPNTAVHVLRR